MPLPFKGEKPALPSNRTYAEHHLQCLKRRFKKDEQYCKDYNDFMTDIIARGDVEKVPDGEINSQPAWYIPHHGVYHLQKPGKIRVFFYCSARFKGTSLNEHLLTGPDLTNTLIGVLCCFRKGQVVIMCDVERMFDQFHVAPEDVPVQSNHKGKPIHQKKCSFHSGLNFRFTRVCGALHSDWEKDPANYVQRQSRLG